MPTSAKLRVWYNESTMFFYLVDDDNRPIVPILSKRQLHALTKEQKESLLKKWEIIYDV